MKTCCDTAEDNVLRAVAAALSKCLRPGERKQLVEELHTIVTEGWYDDPSEKSAAYQLEGLLENLLAKKQNVPPETTGERLRRERRERLSL